MPGRLLLGDCLPLMAGIEAGSVGLVYLDPPFFTQKSHVLSPRTRDVEFKFDDTWESIDEYSGYLSLRLRECHRLLSNNGSLFFHCDRRASHVARTLLDSVFGYEQFRSEIIWHYRRWSNSQRALLPSHQSILYYSKTDNYIFNEIFTDYSASTNVDQLLQKRSRDCFGKAIYRRDETGETVAADAKRGVPLGDVWDIPFLNPKAVERVGYPTQKPVLLLERIISLSTHKGATVLDPFCGSGTSLVAAEMLERNYVGMDISSQAMSISKERLIQPRKTDSRLLRLGRTAYETADQEALECLKGLPVIPVQRNAGIDALISQEELPGPVLLRVQRGDESPSEAAACLRRAARNKKASALVVVATGPGPNMTLGFADKPPTDIFFVNATTFAVQQIIASLALPKTGRYLCEDER